jgi:hypothetical protein
MHFVNSKHCRYLKDKIYKMRSTLFVILLVIACNTIGFAQCNTKTVFVSSTTEYLDSNNVVEQSVPEKTTIVMDKTTVSITPGDHEMKGAIKENTCNWAVPYKEGKSVVKTALTDESGDVKNATLTIEGKDGKVTLIAEIEEMPGKKIRVTADSFQEEK